MQYCHALGLCVLLLLNQEESLFSEEPVPGESRGEETKLLRISPPFSSPPRGQKRRGGEGPLSPLSFH